MAKHDGSSKPFISSAQIDFTIENYGAFFLLHRQNNNAREHLQQNVEPEAQWFGGGRAKCISRLMRVWR